MAAPRSRSRSPEAARRHLPSTPVSTPVCVTETAKVVTTPPDIVSDVDSSCSACLAPSWRLKHTCTKARSQNKRNSSPAVEARHAKRSGTAGVYALMACERFHQGEGSASAIGSLTDVRYLRPVERHVPGPHVPSASHHPSSSQEPPPPTRPPSPVLSPVLSPTFEQRDPADLDGVVVMAEDASLAPAMHVANEVQLDVAPSASQVTSANEPKEYLYPPPEGTFICVALREGVLPPELIVFTSDGGCIVVTHVEARRLSLQARDDEPSWSCGTCGRGPFARARAFACVHCMTCAPMAEDELRRLKEQRRHDGCAQPTRTHSVFYECRCTSCQHTSHFVSLESRTGWRTSPSTSAGSQQVFASRCRQPRPHQDCTIRRRPRAAQLMIWSSMPSAHCEVHGGGQPQSSLEHTRWAQGTPSPTWHCRRRCSGSARASSCSRWGASNSLYPTRRAQG